MLHPEMKNVEQNICQHSFPRHFKEGMLTFSEKPILAHTLKETDINRMDGANLNGTNFLVLDVSVKEIFQIEKFLRYFVFSSIVYFGLL